MFNLFRNFSNGVNHVKNLELVLTSQDTPMVKC